jgi:hypothetical protein
VKYLLLLVLFYSCASASRDWTPWTHCGVAREKEDWRWCKKDRELNPALHDTGWCFIDLQCRYRTTILGNVRTEERSKQLYCSFTDVECMKANELDKKILTHP